MWSNGEPGINSYNTNQSPCMDMYFSCDARKMSAFNALVCMLQWLQGSALVSMYMMRIHEYTIWVLIAHSGRMKI
jgi:hypothetical protein